MSSTELEQYIAERIAEAPTVAEPYPHVFVESVWPHDFYQRMIEYMPDDRLFRVLSDFGTVRLGIYKERFCMPLDEVWFDELLAFGGDNVVLETWRMARAALSAERVWSALNGHFEMQYAERFKDVGCPHHALRLRLMSDRAGYKIGPHTDNISRIFSALFYLPVDWNFESLGTLMYAPNDPTKTYKHGTHNAFDEFTEAGRVPFAPNSMIAFFNADNAFHGVPPLDVPDDYRRHVLLYDLNEVPTARA